MKNNIAKAFEYSNNSFTALQFIALNQSKIPLVSLPTLLAIAAHLPNSRPSIDFMCEITGRCKRSVINDIKKLEKLGILSVYRKHRMANEYQIILGAIAVTPKDILGCNLEQVRVQPGALLGAIAHAPQHTTTYKNIGEDFKNISEEERLERIKLVTEFQMKGK